MAQGETPTIGIGRTIATLAPGSSRAARLVAFPVIHCAMTKVEGRGVETIIDTVMAVPMGEELKTQVSSGVALVLAGTTRANGLDPKVGGATLRKSTVGVGAPAMTATPAAAPRMDLTTARVAGRGATGARAASVA